MYELNGNGLTKQPRKTHRYNSYFLFLFNLLNFLRNSDITCHTFTTIASNKLSCVITILKSEEGNQVPPYFSFAAENKAATITEEEGISFFFR